MKANENLNSTVKTEVAASAKAEPAKTETAKAEPVKKETVKKEPAKKETVKKEPAKKAVKKTAAKAEPAKKETIKKETTKKAAKTTEKKTTTRKTNVKSEMFIQYDGNQVDSAALLERVQADCASEGVKVKELKLYIKPEDNACYYVANGNVAGKVDLY